MPDGALYCIAVIQFNFFTFFISFEGINIGRFGIYVQVTQSINAADRQKGIRCSSHICIKDEINGTSGVCFMNMFRVLWIGIRVNDEKKTRLVFRLVFFCCVIQRLHHVEQCGNSQIIGRAAIQNMLIVFFVADGKVMKRHIVKYPRKSAGSHHRICNRIGVNSRSQLVKLLFAENEGFPSGERCRVYEDARLTLFISNISEGFLVKKIAVKNLFHDVTSIKVCVPIQENVLREEPTSDPANFVVFCHLMTDMVNIVPPFRIKAIVCGRQGTSRNRRDRCCFI